MNFIFNKLPFLGRTRHVMWIFAGLVVVATIHRLILGEQSFNNFIIFRYSFFNLLNGNDLYAAHPDQYYDLYKYSPAFAFLMAPFWYMPAWMGIFVFNLLNGWLPFWAVSKLNIPEKLRAFIMIFVAIELLSSIQNAQSNGIMSGLMIGAFVFFERKNVMMAALFICLGFYIKLFAVIGGILFLFYPGKLKFILWCIVWGTALLIAPMMITGAHGLISYYNNWALLIAHDPAHELNFSIMTLMQRWFHFSVNDLTYLVPGVFLFLLPLIRIQDWKSQAYRMMILSNMLIWSVIFNHKAESPTYVIACFGVAIAAMHEEKISLRRFFLWFTFLFTILSPTDLFPRYVREHFWQPYCLVALPCIIAWLWVEWKLMKGNSKMISIG